MRGMLDFSSWSTALTTVMGLLLVSLLAVGVRLLFMQTFQRRRERENRQINERLKVLIAAYKTLGGSFTGDLTVDPAHRREQRDRDSDAADGAGLPDSVAERRRRIRDAVEAALSDVILLGTDEQVRLAVRAATDMAQGRSVELSDLVVALRDFIRQALDLTPMPEDLPVPSQGPLRVNAGGAGARRPAEARGAAGGRGGGGAGAGGAGVGLGAGAALSGGGDAGDGT